MTLYYEYTLIYQYDTDYSADRYKNVNLKHYISYDGKIYDNVKLESLPSLPWIVRHANSTNVNDEKKEK